MDLKHSLLPIILSILAGLILVNARPEQKAAPGDIVINNCMEYETFCCHYFSKKATTKVIGCVRIAQSGRCKCSGDLRPKSHGRR
ncbi:hypothetical protein BV898_10604 [Hypsibius exemplaris]|uniref:Uncharacterized protein n=1 Tax=Hypsibius exemplaris TaxID=2072580 RepID=A0A1W0WJ86_HYPEX|nr:hypothetical protein BV898_10604 [Hypsibius exemplaris]